MLIYLIVYRIPVSTKPQETYGYRSIRKYVLIRIYEGADKHTIINELIALGIPKAKAVNYFYRYQQELLHKGKK